MRITLLTTLATTLSNLRACMGWCEVENWTLEIGAWNGILIAGITPSSNFQFPKSNVQS
jgi:hypothetical protein